MLETLRRPVMPSFIQTTRLIYFIVVLALFSSITLATEKALSPAQTQAGNQFPSFLYAAEGTNKIIQYGPNGTAVWEYPADMSRDVWKLPNGNVLFCFNHRYDSSKHDNPSGVLEVTQDKKVVFSFSTTGQVWSCQRLSDGNTLVGAASQGKLLIVSPEAKIVKTIQIINQPGHSCMRNARQIENGHFLVAEESAHAAREYDSEGRLLREIKLAFAPILSRPIGYRKHNHLRSTNHGRSGCFRQNRLVGEWK